MAIIIKNFSLIICCLYSYIHILNISICKKQKILLILYSMFLTFFITIIEEKSLLLPYVTLISTLTIFLFLYFKHNIAISFISVFVAFTISYACFAISSIIISLLLILTPYSYNQTTSQFILLLLQGLIIRLPFLLKRTKNGLPFLWKSHYYIPCSMIGILMLIISMFINYGTKLQQRSDFYPSLLLLLTFICTLICILYYRNSITKTYLDELIRRNNLDLSNQLEQLTKKYEDLYADKERLSEIVHSDKKLVNSLKNAVLNYLENGNNDNEKGKALLNEIERYSKEREGNIKATEMFLNPLPSCNITAIDNLLAYMYQKSKQNNIELTLTINCDVSTVSKSLIDIEDFVTLLADLIDNAIIATKHNEGKLILVSFSLIKNRFTIQISDSGIPFTKEVLFNMGRQQITTHADENGNGIGMMKTYKILHKTNASLFIDEKNTAQAPYTKTISVVFNKKHQTILSTNRDETEIAYLYQRSDIIIRKK